MYMRTYLRMCLQLRKTYIQTHPQTKSYSLRHLVYLFVFVRQINLVRRNMHVHTYMRKANVIF